MMHDSGTRVQNERKADVSVIIPTHNRPDSVRQLLLNLEKQVLHGLKVQVTVVENGSCGVTGLAQVHFGKGAAASLSLDLEYVRTHTLLLDARLIGISFLMNILGKRRVQGWLFQTDRS